MDLTTWQKVFEKLMRDTYEGKLKPGELNDTHIRETYNKLNKGLQDGFGGVAGDELPNPRFLKMQQNLYKFSAAKDAVMLADINSKLYKDGKLVSFEAFKLEVEKLNVKYNINWLEAEYRTARQSGHMAQKWEAIISNKKLFPNLKYKTQEDERVREEHAALNNIIAPIDSEFWKKYYPPNGWRCRCDVVQTAENPTEDIPETLSGVKPEFEINIGISGQVYNEDSKDGNKFFALAKHLPDWKKRFEMSKLEGPYYKAATPKGNKVKVSIYADAKDLPANFDRGVIMADQLALKVSIRPHINISDWKNPEYFLNDNIADLYQGDIKAGFRHKREQIKMFLKQYNKAYPNKPLSEDYSIVFDISGIKGFDYNVSRVINGKFKAGSKLQYVVVFKDDKCVKIDRHDDYEAIETKMAKIAKEK